MIGLFAALMFSLEMVLLMAALMLSFVETVSGIRDDHQQDIKDRIYAVSAPSGSPFVPYWS